jgi:hypothetical protein
MRLFEAMNDQNFLAHIFLAFRKGFSKYFLLRNFLLGREERRGNSLFPIVE